MFFGASSFNQDLCSWAPLIDSTAKMDNVFNQSSCPDTSSPLDAGNIAALCHSCEAPVEIVLPQLGGV